MKKTLLSLLSTCFILSPSFSQENKEEKRKENFFYVAPFDLFLNTLQLGYEKKLKNHNALFASAGFKLSETQRTINRIGGNGEIQYKINLLYNKEASNTMAVVRNYSTFAYFAPYLQYRYEEMTDNINADALASSREISIVNSASAGVGFGFRLTGNENRFTVDVFAGGGLRLSDLNGASRYANFLEVGYSGLTPRLGFRMGIAF